MVEAPHTRRTEKSAVIAIVRIALSKPYTFVVLALLIMIFGVMSAIRTPVDIFPDIKIPVISVVWNYTGLPPDGMAGRVVSIYERTLTTTVNDIQHIESQSLAGYGIVKIFFQPNVNIDAALAEVAAISQTVLKQMPAGITPPIILNYNASSVPILQLALSSDRLSQTRLNDLAMNFIRPQVATVPGAAVPAPYGGASRQLQIDLDQHALQSFGLSAADVVAALSSDNLITPTGTEKIGKLEYTVALNDSPLERQTFSDMPIKVVNGTVVYMRDVGTVYDGSPPQTNRVEVNGKPAVLMTILKNGSVSTLDIISNIRRILPQVSQILPPGVELNAVGDQSVFVKQSVAAVIREGVIAACLTALMILLFLGSWRSTLIITVSIPLAILASVTVLSLLGETINVMTLGGLALAVGILVDDATVTIENINYHLEQRKPIETAILDGAQQIVLPATVSLLCICLAFVPMFGLGGVAGYLFRPLAEAVVFAMIASYVLSRTLVPTMANFLLRHQVVHGHGEARPRTRNPIVMFQRGFERRFEGVRNAYRGLLALALENRLTAIGGFLVVAVLSMGLVPYLGQNFFPDIDSGEIRMHVRAQTGTRLEEVTREVDQVAQTIKTLIPPDQLGGIVSNIGLPISGINLSYGNSGTVSVADTDVLITLKGEHPPTPDVVRMLREKLPTLYPSMVFSFLPADIVTQILNFGTPAPIDVQIVGSDLDASRVYADKVLARLKRVPGVADARIQQAFQGPTLNVAMNRTLGGIVGVTESAAAASMLDTLGGSTQTTPIYWLDPATGVSYPVAIQTPQYSMNSLDDLNNLPLRTGDTTQLLGGLADITPGPSNAVDTHYNTRPVIDIYATPQGRDLGAIAGDVRQILADTAKDLPHATTVTMLGQVSTMTSAYQQLYFGLAFAVVLIYLLIVVTFQSWLDPFVIVLALPFALTGIVWMLFLTGTTLSVPALTGAIMCMGVATANSILVISFARERLAAGLTGLEAAAQAGSTRFRPVLMTALAMIIGMAPMALEPGQNAPLGRAVIGGLIFATCATLFFVPLVFSLVHGRDHLKSSNPAKTSHGVPNPA
jgi:multidrug efflux pump subunit AcrB